ncbi:hypothetical protein [Robbsia andropogonis]|uniref:hypothetical protein n=1 Tax=Robbsia andropogonis TaxID=28092 RepID=UPI002A6B829A|nr:hypothetical protein [Robbsia andropogonis]
MLKGIKESTPSYIREWVKDSEKGHRIADDGILRRFPDQLLTFIVGNLVDATIAMADALAIVANMKS